MYLGKTQVSHLVTARPFHKVACLHFIPCCKLYLTWTRQCYKNSSFSILTLNQTFLAMCVFGGMVGEIKKRLTSLLS